MQLGEKAEKVMAYSINPEECISCGACETACPESAISEGDPAYSIDPALCTDCGVCVEVCPPGAIKPPAEAGETEEAP
jgi:ferredoxin